MSKINAAMLKSIVEATASAQGFMFVPANADVKAMLDHQPALIEVNKEKQDTNGNAAARSTAAAQAYLGSLTGAAGSAPSKFAIVTGFVAPAAKRRGNASGAGAPSKYPFADVPLNGSFFVGNSEVEKGNAFKTLGATVSSANRRFSTETGEIVPTQRAKRDDDNKAVVGPDGNKVMETVDVKKRKADKHFKIVAIEAGVKYGEWTAPEAGAMIIRDL